MTETDIEMMAKGYRYKVMDITGRLCAMYTRTFMEIKAIFRGWPDDKFDIIDLEKEKEKKDGDNEI